MGAAENHRPENSGNLGIGAINSSSTPNEIRNESFFKWVKNVFCPNIKYSSIIFILSCLDLIIYLITLFFGIKRTPNELLAPTFETLDTFGMKYPAKIYNGEVHRLILFGLLHANLVHLISNLLSQIILGSIMEGFIGTRNLSFLYLLSNICGGVFSCVMSPSPGVYELHNEFNFYGSNCGNECFFWIR